MPIYPTNDTFRGGFYNNRVVNGNNDRVYDAEDIRKPYDVVFTDGIKPDADGTAGDNLQVSAAGGMVISVGTGYAKLGGAWFENTSAYNITLDNATANTRYDCVIIRNDDSDNVRKPSIYILTLDHVPTLADLTRGGNIYEICVGYITITSNTVSITSSAITDTRIDGVLCNVMSGVGATVIRTYRHTYFSERVGQTAIPIGIPQFDRTRDTLIVMVEGRTFTENTQYTVVNNQYINVIIGIPLIGTKIEFEVLKNINAAGADTVVAEVQQLTNDVNNINRKIQYTYYCNGTNDNAMISNIVKSYLQDGSDYGSMKLIVIGQFGFTSYIRGAGTVSDPYLWFDFNIQSNRKAIVDFTSCSEIKPTIPNNSNNVIFHANNGIDVIGVNVIAANTSNDTVIRIMNTASGVVKFENCRFWITGYKDCIIAKRGNFINCRGEVSNLVNNSYCFITDTNAVIRIVGGEYYAYTGQSTVQSAVVGQSGTNAICILYAVNVPTVARAGYFQTHSIIQWTGGGWINCTDIITTLQLSVISGISNIRGTIPLNKPRSM